MSVLTLEVFLSIIDGGRPGDVSLVIGGLKRRQHVIESHSEQGYYTVYVSTGSILDRYTLDLFKFTLTL